MYSTRELNQMKLKDLLRLEAELQDAIKFRKSTEAKDVRAEIVEVAKRKGFSIEDVFGRKILGAGKGYKSAMQAKYRNPDDYTQTWSGKGRKPNWMVAKLSKGASIDEFRV